MWRRFDIVQLVTTRNITFLSGPPGRPAKPQGNWSIVANLPNGRLLLAKDETIAAVPLTDVRKVGGYDLDKAIKSLKETKPSCLEGSDDGEKEAEEG
jgi:hypothetical protein